MIPLRALGLLMDMATCNENPTLKNIRSRYGVGRDAVQKDLKFLRDNGYVTLEKGLVNSRIISYYKVTDDGLRAAFLPLMESLRFEGNSRVFRLLFEQSGQTNHSLLYAFKVIKSLSRGETEETMPYEFFEKASSEDDEVKAEREKYLARKQKEKREAYQKKEAEKRDKRRMVRREETPKAVWRPLDIAREFADRLDEYWHINPLNVVESRFVPALVQARLKHDTNGEIEYLMIGLFFEAMDFQKYNDAERVWKTFIARFNEFAVKARSMLVSEEQVEQAKSQSDKSWEGF